MSPNPTPIPIARISSAGRGMLELLLASILITLVIGVYLITKFSGPSSAIKVIDYKVRQDLVCDY